MQGRHKLVEWECSTINRKIPSYGSIFKDEVVEYRKRNKNLLEQETL